MNVFTQKDYNVKVFKGAEVITEEYFDTCAHASEYAYNICIRANGDTQTHYATHVLIYAVEHVFHEIGRYPIDVQLPIIE